MSQIDQAFAEAITRLQSWLQFLERKAAEYQNSNESCPAYAGNGGGGYRP